MSDKKQAKTRRYKRPRCLKGQRHRWIMGKALAATDYGTLTSGKGQPSHLRGECKKCHKVKTFHPFAGRGQRLFGQYAAKKAA